MLLLPSLLTFIGCDSGETATDTGDSAADTDTDTGDSAADTDTDTGPMKATLTGTISLDDGSPAENFRVNVCDETICITSKSASDGSYTVSGIGEGNASFYVEAVGDSAYGVPYAPMAFVAGEAQSVSLSIREIDGTTSLNGNAEHWLGDWAILDADATTYTTSLGGAIPDITWTRTEGPLERPPVAFEGETLIGLIYLGALKGKAEEPGTLSFPNPGNLPAGTEIKVYYAELPEVSVWTLGGTLTVVESDAMLSGTASLPVLTALAMTLPN